MHKQYVEYDGKFNKTKQNIYLEIKNIVGYTRAITIVVSYDVIDKINEWAGSSFFLQFLLFTEPNSTKAAANQSPLLRRFIMA